ncbi:DUF1127 domain-containing protein [Sagittula salina]|uniref:DUF1127 domain-containing protein n=1 Tax=Sagittula salina TaxID=2820268 RepID=A0A940MSD4_9RHOB|nr:DUF1127 domain-containing protein [Sagittula salina]MBP0483803.1 DUF1127 domain-containing protein [Sagittula salina]
MSAFDTTRIPSATGSAARIGSVFASAFGALNSWNDARVTRKSLSALSDRELSDIGLCRGDIDTVAKR